MLRTYLARPITADWIAQVRAAIRAREDYGQIELAADCECSQAAISKVLRSPGTVSKLVEPMSDALGINIPAVTGPVSPEYRQVLEALDALDEDGRAALVAHAQLLLWISDK